MIIKVPIYYISVYKQISWLVIILKRRWIKFQYQVSAPFQIPQLVNFGLNIKYIALQIALFFYFVMSILTK